MEINKYFDFYAGLQARGEGAVLLKTAKIGCLLRAAYSDIRTKRDERIDKQNAMEARTKIEGARSRRPDAVEGVLQQTLSGSGDENRSDNSNTGPLFPGQAINPCRSKVGRRSFCKCSARVTM